MLRLKSLAGAAALLACLWLPVQAEAKIGKDCTAIYDACQAAGFLPAKDGSTGQKINKNCMEPLLKGVQPPGKGRIALPRIDPAVIAACQAENGAGKGGGPKDAAAKAARADGRSVGNPPAAVKPLPAGAKPGANMVLILVDDFSLDLMSSQNGVLAESMPNLARMMKEGMSFANYYVTDSLCCPSRTSIFTGMLPHNSGVISNVGADGGYDAFMAHEDDAKSFATLLHDGFYQTAMMGKFLNGYNQSTNGIPQGWSDWAVSSKGYANFDYVLNVNGVLASPAAHMTDEISGLGQDFIDKAKGSPFFLELATFSPHAPFVPPERYKDAFPGLTYPHSPAFGARPDAAAPSWLKALPQLSQKAIRKFDVVYRKRVQSDKGIDDMIGAVRKKLADLGLSDTTYVIFPSDNGYHMGEYSLGTGKMTPFDTDIHVPLVVVGPGVAAGKTASEIAMNIDLAPTFAEMAGLPPLASFDGHSLLGVLHGGSAPPRSLAVIEHQGTDASNTSDPDTDGKTAAEGELGNPPTYVALRLQQAMYVEYLDGSGEIGYYDLKADPYALHNIAATLPADRLKALHAALLANHACAGATSCGATMALTP